MPGPLELWCIRVPALSAYAYQKASSSGLAYKPRDKAKVEVGVQVVQRWILARLRHQRFFSLAELNGAIGQLVEN